MHHTAHHTRHTQKGKVFVGYIDAYLIDVPQTGKQETAEAADKQTRCEGTTTTATTIGGTGREYFRQQDEGYIGNQQVIMSIEHRIVQYHIPVHLRLTVQQQVDVTVSLTEQGGEEEDQ